MGILSETLDEFKRAKTPEKVFIVGGAIAVVAIAVYVHKQSSANNPAQGATPASGGTSTMQGGIQTVPTGSGGSVPILPTGLVPIFDSSGNLLGYQPGPTGTTSSGSPGTKTSGGPLIPFGQYKGPNYSNLAPNTKYTYNGISYFLQPGPQGKLYGTPVGGGQQQLLYAPQSFYPKQGGGPYGTAVLAHRSSRIAPVHQSRRQSTTAARVYSMRSRGQYHD